MTCWVGSAEVRNFIRQNALLANIWTGLGAQTCTVKNPAATISTSSTSRRPGSSDRPDPLGPMPNSVMSIWCHRHGHRRRRDGHNVGIVIQALVDCGDQIGTSG